MVWNYQDEDVSGPAAAIDLELEGSAERCTRVLVRHYRIDQDHSNAYTVWKQMGSPQKPKHEQYRTLEAAGQLQLARFAVLALERGRRRQNTIQPAACKRISLLELSW